ncbi:MAG: helical backbone metal receptor [Nocardioides sp.]|nr:helical backbone metal receptor [Nocardioides sp.]
MSDLLDDMGVPVALEIPPARVVSLVPSLTEALAVSRPGLLVGATDWCTHPADLDVPRVRGTKNPDLRAIADLEPDLVIANMEENRELDVHRLRDRGIAVWVTVTESVPQAVDAMDRLFCDVLGGDLPEWLVRARRQWCGEVPDEVARVAVPIWRDPWMVVGRDTFTGDVLRRIGLRNVYDDHEGRYPAVEVADIERRDPDVVLLPDEPYVFTAEDGPEMFTGCPTRLVSGRLLTWYGPALVEAWDELAGTFAGN